MNNAKPSPAAAPLRWLLDGDLERWFNAARDQPGCFWLLQHIPKTAGTSLRAELAAKLRPQANICLNYRAPDGLHQFSRIDDALTHFLSHASARRYRFASGHLYRPQLLQLQARFPKHRLITMLRHPVERAISDYRYQRTPKHPPHQRFIADYPSFADWLRAPGTQNRMHAYLSLHADDSAAAVIDALETQYCFVGLTEHYAQSRQLLFALLGLSAADTHEHRNATEPAAAAEREQIAALRDEIIARNDKDMAIFTHLQQRYSAVSARIAGALIQRPVQASPDPQSTAGGQ